jgi:phage replication initiation protein
VVLDSGEVEVDSIAAKPPTGNHGGAHTTTAPASDPDLEILVDWVGFTLPDGADPYAVRPGWSELPWVELERGRLGYLRSIVCGHLRVDWSGRPDMGVHVEMSGQGCREAESLGLVTDWPKFLADLLRDNAKISRLDVAVDERGGLLDLPVIIDACEQGHLTSRWDTFTLNPGKRRFGEAPRGAPTLYLGSAQSKAQGVIYDKRAEQVARGLPAGDSPWVRFELTTRDERAQKLAWHLAVAAIAVENGLEDEWAEVAGKVVVGVLRAYVEFRDPEDSASRIERRRKATWWEKFCNGVAAVRLASGPRSALTVESARRWLQRQVAPTLGMLMEFEGGALDWLLDLIHEGQARMTVRHQVALALSG